MKRTSKPCTKMLIFAALFVAVICVFSQIYFPIFAVPITFQVFAVCICGYFLGVKYSVLSVLVYIILGAIGLPVFYGFQGGAQHLLSLTGGFILGFLPLTFCCGISKKINLTLVKVLLGIAGVVVCHLIGVVQFSVVSSNGLIPSFIMSSLPYLLKDIILCIFAFYISKLLMKRIK